MLAAMDPRKMVLGHMHRILLAIGVEVKYGEG